MNDTTKNPMLMDKETVYEAERFMPWPPYNPMRCNRYIFDEYGNPIPF